MGLREVMSLHRAKAPPSSRRSDKTATEPPPTLPFLDSSSPAVVIVIDLIILGTIGGRVMGPTSTILYIPAATMEPSPYTPYLLCSVGRGRGSVLSFAGTALIHFLQSTRIIIDGAPTIIANYLQIIYDYTGACFILDNTRLPNYVFSPVNSPFNTMVVHKMILSRGHQEALGGQTHDNVAIIAALHKYHAIEVGSQLVKLKRLLCLQKQTSDYYFGGNK